MCGMRRVTGARWALVLMIYATLAMGSARAHDPDPEPDPQSVPQIRSQAPAAGDDLDDGSSVYLALRPGASADATEEFLEEIYVERPAVLQALANDLDEDDLIAQIQDPSNVRSATALCQLGNLYAAEGYEEDAFKCFQASAESLDLGGMYNYAHALFRGRGCEKNEPAATAWFREAAAMLCDSKTFVKRHFPQRFLVSEPGSDSKEELCVSFDDDCNRPTRVVATASGSVVWDHTTDSEEQFEQFFQGLKVVPADTENDAVELLPTPPPARSGYREAVIGNLSKHTAQLTIMLCAVITDTHGVRSRQIFRRCWAGRTW